jgi:hypothetical protein
MNLTHRTHVVSLFLCGLICLTILAGTVSSGFAKSAESLAIQSANSPGPSLTLVHYSQDEDVLTVRGQGFTPEGKAYLAIYDQLGKRLYENRWVTATARATYDAGPRAEFDSSIVVHSPGGELVAKFTGLCGASALIRALDDSTERWTTFQVIQPVCGRTAAPTVANGLLRPESLPPATHNSAWGTVISDLDAISPPALIDTYPTSIDGTIIVTGEDFTAGGSVYVAIYDQMGAQLYETRWAEATPAVAITGSRAEVPEAHSITSPTGGALQLTFAGLCGAQVLIRAYDQQTANWSNWLNVAPLCESAPAQPVQGYGPH